MDKDLPSKKDPRSSREYWTNALWRTEPEIDEARQAFLAKRREIQPDIPNSIYPFKGEKLTRADVEWLLMTLESGGFSGPINWLDHNQHERDGLDLRGANLQGVHLTALPLSRLRAGLTHPERRIATHVQRHNASINFINANLDGAFLEEAGLGRARLEHSNLEFAHLEKSDLGGARLQGASLRAANLAGAYLRRAFFDAETNFDDIKIWNATFGCAILVDASWGNANLATINWRKVQKIGDETRARKKLDSQNKKKSREKRIENFQDAVRANRQLATTLRNQGMSEFASHFSFRSQICERQELRRRRNVLGYIGSWVLQIAAGYGYQPQNTIWCYVFTISVFSCLYYTIGQHNRDNISFLSAIILSIISFHGRGLFTQNINLNDPILTFIAIEAIIGLIIEISFIASFTQRFFTR